MTWLTGAPSTAENDLALNTRSEEHTSELQSLAYLVCRLLLEKKKNDQHPSSLISPPPPQYAAQLLDLFRYVLHPSPPLLLFPQCDLSYLLHSFIHKMFMQRTS